MQTAKNEPTTTDPETASSGATGVSQHYRGDRGAEYVEKRQHTADHPGYGLNLAYFLPHLKREHTVLDFGCGNGGMLRLLKDHVAVAEGLEVNSAARQIAEGTGCRVWSAVSEIPEGRYDAIVSNHVLEHVRNVCDVLEELRLRLRPGGIVAVKLPIDDFRSSHQRGYSRKDIDHHLQTWTPRLMANTFYESGFDVRECRVITSSWHPKLFPLIGLGVSRPAFWALAMVLKRRQLFAVAVRT